MGQSYSNCNICTECVSIYTCNGCKFNFCESCIMRFYNHTSTDRWGPRCPGAFCFSTLPPLRVFKLLKESKQKAYEIEQKRIFERNEEIKQKNLIKQQQKQKVKEAKKLQKQAKKDLKKDKKMRKLANK